MRRREFLVCGAAAAALLTCRLSFANTTATARSRFVFVILRGALDGLAAVPPYGDPDYASLRRDLALPASSLLPLNDLFGLHPSLTFFNESFAARELVVFHAVASPYRERSHFDGQDVLESGYVRGHATQSGWLNRGLAALPAGRAGDKELGVALGQNVPLVMRGPAAVTSWSPSKLAALDDDTLERIADLYAGDPLLARRLADALAADAIATAPMIGGGADRPGAVGKNAAPYQTTAADETAGPDRIVAPDRTVALDRIAAPDRTAAARTDRTLAPRRSAVPEKTAAQDRSAARDGSAAQEKSAPDGRLAQDKDSAQDKTAAPKGARYTEVIHAAAEFLRREDGPKVAVFDTTGWDTHANEGGVQGQLAARLAALDAGLRSLKEQLGPVWSDTVVLLATEFGRTAAINGTRGTDHGTGAAAFLIGGAVRGGRVVADWPGLSNRALYQGRDLTPTLDLRSVFKGVLQEHLLVPARALDTAVFPDSHRVKTLSGLVRT